ncbi:hypothetical protein HBA55_13240 [Pseudomaricurvus alkylphenolicus]|uniref:hypothetical protein n=1 Tax=Pseudomaricurvus alkylphenolicus TaxID=1306991 RepID=UPI00142014A2|nr:hypothetical protein [Pseudomaricurvus alkylphenolicus]NIB40559.1 hypothetical protein [Pseudomaricurvus alkylphenolicus]
MAKQLSLVVLTIEAGDASASSGITQGPATIPDRVGSRRRGAVTDTRVTVFNKQPIRGTIVSTIVPQHAQTEAVTTSYPINGEYNSNTGVLRYWRMNEGRRFGLDMVAIFNEEATAMAVVATKTPILPFVFHRGSEVRPSLKALADLDPLSPMSQSSNRVSDVEIRARKTDARTEHQRQLKELTAQIQASVRARTKNRTAQLRAQKKKLIRDFAAQRSAQSSTTAPSSPGVICPSHIVAWVQELERNGASLQSIGELPGLFRPAVFSRHFGKAFADFTPADLNKLQQAMQGPCAHDGGVVANSNIRLPLSYTLNGRPGNSVTEVGIAGIATELIAAWHVRVSAQYLNNDNLEEIEALQNQLQPFISVLWPQERNSARNQMAARQNELRAAKVAARFDEIEARLKSGDGWAVDELHILSKWGGLYDGIDDETVKEFGARMRKLTHDGIVEHLDIVLAQIRAAKDPRQKMDISYLWYGGAAYALRKLAPHTPTRALKEFWPKFGAERELAYRALKPEFITEIDAIKHRPASMSYGHDFKILIDAKYSPTFREIEAYRLTKQTKLEDLEFVARVGEGPHDPDYPGAILLNAIYRNDLKQIKAEDILMHKAFIKQMEAYSDNQVFRMASLLSGSGGSRAEAQWWVEQEIRKSSMINPILGFFAASYQSLYPGCMEADAVTFKKTSGMESVVRNGYGAEISSVSTVKTQNFTINRRHVEAFQKLNGDVSTPESLGVFARLHGDGIPLDMQAVLKLVNDALVGLRQAMSSNACDSDIIRKLDQNMLAIYNAKNR